MPEGALTIFNIYTLKFKKTRHFWTDFDWTFLRSKITLTRRRSPIPLIVIVDHKNYTKMLRVVFGDPYAQVT